MAAPPTGALLEVGIVSDEMVTEAFIVRRLWHTPLDLERSPALALPRQDRVAVMLLVDGGVTVFADDEPLPLAVNDALLYTAGGLRSIHGDTPTARIELSLARPPSVLSGSPRFVPGTESAVAPAALSSLANVILNAEGSPRAVVTEPLRKMLAATVELLVAENATPSFGARPPQRLFEDARTYIETWGHSPTVTASSVAEGMHVSRQYLTRVFGAHGTSIGAELRRHRASLAERLLAEALMSPHEAATAAGFSSLRAMRRALRESC
ncbi:helix-turn-helix domain-containing protein [Microbacterium sp. LMI1-1-1.1]|uniref:helix-turn-helix domain-containing protein n=1 Tax=Microbacterium sp. LMI1-1-1.1 TaxID=3135223 RepID=UPI0034677EB8